MTSSCVLASISGNAVCMYIDITHDHYMSCNCVYEGNWEFIGNLAQSTLTQKCRFGSYVLFRNQGLTYKMRGRTLRHVSHFTIGE